MLLSFGTGTRYLWLLAGHLEHSWMAAARALGTPQAKSWQHQQGPSSRWRELREGGKGPDRAVGSPMAWDLWGTSEACLLALEQWLEGKMQREAVILQLSTQSTWVLRVPEEKCVLTQGNCMPVVDFVHCVDDIFQNLPGFLFRNLCCACSITNVLLGFYFSFA